ncbi:MAG: hypothetical protein NVS3B26_23920 [Mycobacteriales bacterium]
MTGFIQIIEYQTSRVEEMRALNDEWRREHPDLGPVRVTVTEDRDRRGTFVSLVEFASIEEADRNNDDPLTREFAARMHALADAPPTFRNLEVLTSEVRLDKGRWAKV